MSTIDLRSDTVTKPTAKMREAMARAEVGDDVFGDDPTVHRLEALAASIMGKEKAIMVVHYWINNRDISRTYEVFRHILRNPVA